MFKAKALVILTVYAMVNSIFFLFAWCFLVCSLEKDSSSSRLMCGVLQTRKYSSIVCWFHFGRKIFANWQEITSCVKPMHVTRGMFKHVSEPDKGFIAAEPWRIPRLNVGGF